MDEFKQILSAPYWVKAINTEIPTMRKKNAHFIFATQTPDSIIDSPVCAEVINNSATQVFIPNSSANENLYKNHLKLNDSEFDFVKSTPVSSRLMLIKQGTTSMICRLDLSDLSDEVRVLSGNIKTAQILDKVIEEKGENPDNWLDTFIKRSKKS
jgi:type IV secretion system protein VirB4